jgi:hemoglobin
MEDSGQAPPTLYEWAGGGDAIARMINCFYDRVEQDELISPFFPAASRARTATT